VNWWRLGLPKARPRETAPVSAMRFSLRSRHVRWPLACPHTQQTVLHYIMLCYVTYTILSEKWTSSFAKPRRHFSHFTTVRSKRKTERKGMSWGLIILGTCKVVDQCFSTGVPRNLWVPPVVSKGSAGPPLLSKKIKLCPTFPATICVFWAPSRSKMYRFVWRIEIKICGALRRSPSWWGSLSPPPKPTPCSRHAALNFGPSGLRSPPQLRHGFREQSKLLQRVPLHWKGWKTLS